MLSKFADRDSLELLADRIKDDNDHELRLMAAKLLVESDHSRVSRLLEKHINHRDEKVRVAVFKGLRKHLGENELKPIDLALGTNQPDIGRLAVEALEKLAAKDDQALTRLTNAP